MKHGHGAQYWTCQVVGWGAYSALGLTVGAMENGWRAPIVIGYVLFFAYSIALSHGLRSVIRHRGWMTLPLWRALPRFAAAVVIMAAVQATLVVALNGLLEGPRGLWSAPSSIVYMFLYLCVVGAIWSILYVSLTALRHSRETRRNEIRMKMALSEAELRALEAQVNPHFLFNCLNSIRGMIVEDAAQAQDMVTRLANLLRYNLQRDRRHTVPLASEVEAVSDYLALESIRFEDRLRVHLQVDEAARQTPVPPMLLQTLVENAIKHGVEELPAGGDLCIRARVENRTLRIDVENAGRLGPPRPDATQIGLSNARERLRILYGESASLELADSGEGRVAATILIPVTA